MPRMKLTDQAVQRLKAPPRTRIDYFDILIPGFGLRVAGPTPVTPDGRKSWVVLYRYGGVQTRLTIGTYPKLTLEKARDEARAKFALLSKGLDPAAAEAAAEVERNRKRMVFGDAAERFLAEGMEPRKGRRLAPRYVEETRRNIRNHVLPRWRDRDLESIARKDVDILVRAVMEGKVEAEVILANKGRVKGGPIAANRVLAALGAMFMWAIRKELVKSNPCTLADKPGEERRGDRTLSPEEVIELWGALDGLGYPFGTFLQVALLTGQRRINVARARWSDIDLEGRVWLQPPKTTKSKRQHAVPLSELVVELLRRVPRKSVTVGGKARPSAFVFTTNGQTAVSGFSYAKAAIDQSISASRSDRGADAMERWTIHDLRRTCATNLGRLGTPGEIVSKVLDHAPQGITNTTYNLWENFDEKRAALDRWSEHVRELLARVPSKPPGAAGETHQAREYRVDAVSPLDAGEPIAGGKPEFETMVEALAHPPPDASAEAATGPERKRAGADHGVRKGRGR